ncbi:hypothetical protein M9Y10_008758 [Tritrichomonas musculus]|uniref:Uncharacterized protein n=1 Tax=Tritrichomonas musculus TaxID=1915356 RepID=A0ABR2IZ18_9EUKA
MSSLAIDDKMNGLYKRINKYYKTINREMLKQIVKRTDEITDLYFEYVNPNMSDKERRQNEKVLMTKRILNNKKCNEVCTFNGVLSFICGIYHFLHAYDYEPNKLFHHCNIWDFIHCAVHSFNMEKSFMFMFNDENIPETVKRFLSISDEEIMELLKLNFD